MPDTNQNQNQSAAFAVASAPANGAPTAAPSNPYAEFGGSIAPPLQSAPDTAQKSQQSQQSPSAAPVKAAANPYAEFGGSVAPPLSSTGAPTTPSKSSAPSNPLLGVLSGIGGGVMESAQGVKNLANKVLPNSMQIPDIPKEYREERSTSEKVGGFAEDVMEFIAGDEALKGLSLGDKLGYAQKIAKFAEAHPSLAKIVTNGIQSAIVGGGQGAVKGSAEGHTVQGATSGAIGGGIGGAAGSAAVETAAPIAKALGEKFGIGTTAVEDAVRGARPGKRNYRFAEDFKRAAPYMDAENSAAPAKTVEEWADNTEQARENLYAKKIQPIVDKHATVPLGGLNIAESIRNEIPETMKTFKPEAAKQMEELANQFMPGQKFQLQIGDSEAALQHFNAELRATGFWSKMPSERAALLKTDGTIAGLKAAGDAIRDELYGKLADLEPKVDIASLKKDYGALRNVEDEIRGRINVNNRQAPISLKETIGLITGLGHGGPVGAAMAAIPILDRFGNSPENLIARGVKKAVRPAESTLENVARATGQATPKYAGATGVGVADLHTQPSEDSDEAPAEGQE